MNEKIPHSIEAEEESYTMGDSLTENVISPKNSGGSNSSCVDMSEARFTSMSNIENTSADFEDHPRGMGENSNSSADNLDDEYYDSDEEDEDEEESDEPPLSLEELLYSASSYHAIVRPVSATMILAALSSVYINTEESRELGQEQFASAYNIWQVDNSGDGSVGKNLIASVGNTFIMVLGIGTMTFGIVLLYKYRCMKFLIGYMIFSSASLLGLLGDYMLSIAIQVYQIPIDIISYSLIMYNFAIVGVMSIFYQKGIPQSITQTYLVFTSVILAWHLSHFDDWTAWTLLVMLALYDLCAVLSPCGPLKALVNLMQDKDAPEMPGLLYEAQLPTGTNRPGGRKRNNIPRESENSSRRRSNNDSNSNNIESTGTSSSTKEERGNEATSSKDSIQSLTANTATEIHGPHAFLPLAIAKVYRLPLVSRYTFAASNFSRRQRKRLNSKKKVDDTSSTINKSPLLADNINEEESLEEFYTREFSVPELISEVEVELPRNGGRIEKVEDSQYRFVVIGKNGEMKRKLFINKKGRVFDVTDEEDNDSVYDEDPSSIRLGLGDFIFYSVLVSKAAMYSFTTFAACMLVILAGLGATLVFLSVYHSALPALPISIFLGVIFYLLTRVLIEPWIEVVLTTPVYV